MASYAPPPQLRRDAAPTLCAPTTAGEGNWAGAPCHRRDGRHILAVRSRTANERGRAVRFGAEDGDDLELLLELTADETGRRAYSEAARSDGAFELRRAPLEPPDEGYQ